MLLSQIAHPADPDLSQQHHPCQAAQSRLDALENDNPDDAPDPFGLAADEDDDEFVMAESDDEGTNVDHLPLTQFRCWCIPGLSGLGCNQQIIARVIHCI